MLSSNQCGYHDNYGGDRPSDLTRDDSVSMVVVAALEVSKSSMI